jgi:hypothetical protein
MRDQIECANPVPIKETENYFEHEDFKDGYHNTFPEGVTNVFRVEALCK